MKPPSYKTDHSGAQSIVFRLDVVATFLDRSMAEEFARLKNADPIEGFAVSADGNEFCVTRAWQLAIFTDGSLADEYAEMKAAREIRQQQVIGGNPDKTAATAPQPAPVEEPLNFNEIWAKAASGDVTR